MNYSYMHDIMHPVCNELMPRHAHLLCLPAPQWNKHLKHMLYCLLHYIPIQCLFFSNAKSMCPYYMYVCVSGQSDVYVYPKWLCSPLNTDGIDPQPPQN